VDSEALKMLGMCAFWILVMGIIVASWGGQDAE